MTAQSQHGISRRALIGGIAAGAALAPFVAIAGPQSARATGPVVLVVKKDGTGDFTSPWDANASITDSGPSKPYVIEVHPGSYAIPELVPKDNVTIRGTDRATCVLVGDQPDDVDPVDTVNNSTVKLIGTASLEHLTIHARNQRYAIHDEHGGLNTDAVHSLLDCLVVHAGNQGAVNWQATNHGPGGVWVYDAPYGYGAASGLRATFTDCTFQGVTRSWFVHNNLAFSAPNVNTITGCTFLTSAGYGHLLNTQSLGSGTADSVTISGSTWSDGWFLDSDVPWIPTDPARQIADHTEYAVTIHGTDPLGYLNQMRGQALRITSASTAAGSSIAVGGSAVPTLFGTVTTVPGGAGLNASVHGSWDVSGITVGLSGLVVVANTLGSRLGDRTGSPLQLDISVDGGAIATVVFDQDHSGQSNAQVLALINAALGSSGTADAWLVAPETRYASFPDRMSTATNVSSTGIPRWTAVIAPATAGAAAAPTTAPLASVVGVAVDRALPGQSTRVLRSGDLHVSQLRGITATIPAGTHVYLSDTVAGAFALSGTRLFGTAVATDWVRFALA
jgi:hypothetical protein